MGHNDTKNIGKIHKQHCPSFPSSCEYNVAMTSKKILGVFPTGKFNIHNVRQVVEYLGV
jgi:hypothetical protein